MEKEIREKIEKADLYQLDGDRWYNWQVSLWEKNGKSRLYVNLAYGRRRKWNRRASYFIDLKDFRIEENRRDYSNAYERSICKNAAELAVEILGK